VKYKFEQKEDRTKFQEDLRDKDLLETFEFDSIKSKRSGRNGPFEANNEDIKLWRRRDLQQSWSLSFYGSGVADRHLEFPMHWFSADAERDKDVNMVKLRFLSRKTSPNDTPSSPRRTSTATWLGRKFSSASLETHSIPFRGPSLADNRASISTVGSASSAGSHEDVSPDLSENEKLAETLKYLSIRFSTTEDYDSFLKEFNDIQKQMKEPPVFSAPYEMDSLSVPARPPDSHASPYLSGSEPPSPGHIIPEIPELEADIPAELDPTPSYTYSPYQQTTNP